MTTGIELIAKERQEEQIEKHGFTGEHHVQHPEWYGNGQLLEAARILTCDIIKNVNDGKEVDFYCPLNWDKEWWARLVNRSPLERIVIAGSFMAAEIDRRYAIPPPESITNEDI